MQISPRVNRTNLECGELYVQALAAMPGCAAQVRALGSGCSRRVSTSLNINDLEIVVFDVFVVLLVYRFYQSRITIFINS